MISRIIHGRSKKHRLGKILLPGRLNPLRSRLCTCLSTATVDKKFYELRAVKIGGRGQWRVNQADLEAFITDQYQQTEQFIAEHPFSRVDADDEAT